MVQEFHVLKCYSCEAFQVQQVKKSKQWNCKMCGEKQSIIKVFGRGSGVDCRRHVQKLNTRRGEILEDQNQNAWLRWENTGEEVEGNELGDKAQEHDNHTVVDIQRSRWSKYLLNPSGVPSPEEEGEEENVSMDRNHSPASRNIRKRKRGRGGSTYQTREEHRETSHGDWRTAGKKTVAHPRTFPSSSATAEGSASCRSAPARTNPNPGRATSQPPPSTPTTSQLPLKPAVPNTLNTSSCRPVSSADAAVSKTSRWAQFLTSPSPEEQEEEFLSQHVDRDGDPVQDYTKAPATLPGCASSSLGHNSSSLGHNSSQLASSSLGHSSSSLGHSSSSQNASSSSLGLLPEDGFLGRKLGSSFSRLRSTFSLCGFGDVTHGNRGPAPVALHQREETVCHQPPPTKRPCPSLPAASLFNTDEDFDDAFEL
ncbi:MRN complex-interacting protein [Hypomesus transpacificus]|uniref:MRN complex-interacting protein n=1 Tax=Hypomesus transpacificus TaxID=137520 RepID=UPI001F07FA2A|nr:MRN complex-interacting protein [Hypomesus transpacificus]